MAARQTATRFGRTLGCGHCPVGPCMLKNNKQDNIIARRFLWTKPVRQNEVTELDRHPWGIFRRVITERYFNPVNPMALFMIKGKLNHQFNWCGTPKVLTKSHTWVSVMSLKVNLNHLQRLWARSVRRTYTQQSPFACSVKVGIKPQTIWESAFLKRDFSNTARWTWFICCLPVPKSTSYC